MQQPRDLTLDQLLLMEHLPVVMGNLLQVLVMDLEELTLHQETMAANTAIPVPHRVTVHPGQLLAMAHPLMLGREPPVNTVIPVQRPVMVHRVGLMDLERRLTQRNRVSPRREGWRGSI